MNNTEAYRERMKGLNDLAAKAFRAELEGNQELASELNAQLDDLRKKESTHILTKTNSAGLSMPVTKKQKTLSNTLKSMYEQEKFRSSSDQNADFMKLSKKYGAIDADTEPSGRVVEDEDQDRPSSSSLNRDKQEYNRVQDLIEDCRHCMETEFCKKHLMISMGQSFYLSVPEREPLVDNFCCIVPVRHVASANLLDENEWDELQKFRKALVNMFLKENDEDVVFFETVKSLRNYPHTVINCMPINKEEGDLLPIYFKKAIDECEMEWAQNKKLIDLRNKDIRTGVPKGLPYFNVSFGMQEGYAHVIEDEKLFPKNFAEQILGNILDLDHNRWRKPQFQTKDQQDTRVQNFLKLWSSYEFNF